MLAGLCVTKDEPRLVLFCLPNGAELPLSSPDAALDQIEYTYESHCQNQPENVDRLVERGWFKTQIDPLRRVR